MTSKEAKTHIIDTLNGDMNKEYFINEILSEILKDLERLESIDNANPSEALNYLNIFINEMTYCLEHPKEYAKGYDKEIFYKYKYSFETTIKQALERLEEYEKVLNGHCSKCANRENNICVGMDAPIHIDTLINCIEMENQELKEENKVLEACIKDWEDDYEHLEFYFKNREKALEILKKYLYYDNKNHAIKMKEVRKSIYNFDYEDLKDVVDNEKD